MNKLLVSIKRVIDFNVKIHVKADNSGIETANVKMSINPFDEIALEEAIRLKEQGQVQETLAVTIGPESSQEILRLALAMGIDRALHIQTERLLEPFNVAQILQHLVSIEQPDLILLGKQAIDDDCNQTGQMLAALLSWAQGTFVSKLTVAHGKIKIWREVDEGIESLELTLPAVITTDLRLNQPRYPSLPNIMQAKQKRIDTIALATLPLNLRQHSQIKEVSAPRKEKTCIYVSTAQELVDKLHYEAKVI